MRYVSLAQLDALVRQEADLAPWVSDATAFVKQLEMASYLTAGLRRLWGQLKQKPGDDYILNPTAFNLTTQSGVSQYALPPEFLDVCGVDVSSQPNPGANDWTNCKPYMFKERNIYSGAAGVYSFLGVTNVRFKIVGNTINFIPSTAPMPLSVRLWYVPACPILVPVIPSAAYPGATQVVATGAQIVVSIGGLQYVFIARIGGTTGGSQPTWAVPTPSSQGAPGVSGTFVDGTVTWDFGNALALYQTMFDAISGWEEIAVLHAAIICKDKQESDTSVLERRLAKLEEDLASEIENRQSDEPMRIVDDYYNNMGGTGFGIGGGASGDGF